MDIAKIAIGADPPKNINLIIEVPLRSDSIKYEFDKKSGAIVVDRFLYTTMFYPCNYGFIPHTLAEDGDPVDVMVVGRMPVQPGAVLSARPIGVLELEDEAGGDEKVLAVPTATSPSSMTGSTAGRTSPRSTSSESSVFRALQGPGAREMDPGRQLARCRRRAPPDHRGDRPRPLGSSIGIGPLTR